MSRFRVILAILLLIILVVIGIVLPSLWESSKNTSEKQTDLASSKEFTFEERKEETIMTKDNVFAGKTIVATGKLENFTRSEINDKILELGAKPGSSVTGKTNYLICGEKAGSKLEKAKKLGVTILSEEEFLQMIA